MLITSCDMFLTQVVFFLMVGFALDFRLVGALVLWCRGFVAESFLEEALAENSRNSVI